MESLKILDLNPEEIIKYLKEIFLYYACTGLSAEQEHITTKNLLKFFNECNLSDQLLSKNRLECIFISEKRKTKSLNFEVFLEVISKVSKAAYPDLLEVSDSIYYFLDKHVVPLYQEKLKKTANLRELDSNTLEILDGVTPMLQSLYKEEFPWEIYNAEVMEEIKTESKNKVMRIFYALGIVPDLLGPAKAIKICSLLLGNSCFLGIQNLECDNIGTIFTFQHFLESLLYACNDSKIDKSLFFHERFTKFLEQIEASKPSVKFSLFKVPQMVTILKNSSKADQEINETLTQTISFEQVRVSNLLEDLEDIFRVYSHWCKKSQKHYLNLTKFLSVLSDSQLIQTGKSKGPGLPKHEAELVFYSICFGKTKQSKKSHDSGKMNFSQFFKALETIALRLYPDLERSDSLKALIQSHLISVKQNTYETEIRALQHMLKDPKLIEVLYNLGQSLLPYIRFYLNENNQMNLESFEKFCKNFSVFPDLIPKVKLVPIFYCLAATNAKNTMMLTGTKSLGKLLRSNEEYLEPQFINFEMFIDAIAICALETVSINRTPEEKIEIAIEKITQSTGAANISLKSGHTRSSCLEKSDFLLFCKKEKAIDSSDLNFVQHLFKKQNFN